MSIEWVLSLLQSVLSKDNKEVLMVPHTLGMNTDNLNWDYMCYFSYP